MTQLYQPNFDCLIKTKCVGVRSCFYVLLFFYFWLVNQAVAQQLPPALTEQQYDCTDVRLEKNDPSLLTKEEQLALLDVALMDSIDRFASCINQAQRQLNGSGGNGGANNDNGNGQGSSGKSELQTSDSTQAQDAKNEADKVDTDETESLQEIAPDSQTIDKRIEQNKRINAPAKPRDNDAIICQILYDAIINEQDPITLKGLQIQYADYKCGT